MAKFKMKGIKMLSNNKPTTLDFSNSGRSLSSSPLRVEPETEGEVTWNPETITGTENQAVEGGTNQITNFNQTGNQNFNDSGELLPDEDYAKKKLDPEYIKKEELYKERQKEIERQRSETKFIPDDPNPSASVVESEPPAPKNYQLKQYVFASNYGFGSAAGFGKRAIRETGAFPDAESAYKAMSMNDGDNFGGLYNEMYVVNDDGTRTLVKGGPTTTVKEDLPRWDKDLGKVVPGYGSTEFTTQRDDSFPDMQELYKNKLLNNEAKRKKEAERERLKYEMQAERKYQIEQAKAKREEEKASKAAIVAEKKRIAKEKVNKNRAAKGLKLIE